MSTDTLLPQARRLVAELGEMPTRNRLMAEFSIAGPRASTIRDELIREETRAQLATPRIAPARPRRKRLSAHVATLPRRLRQVSTRAAAQAPTPAPEPIAPAQVTEDVPTPEHTPAPVDEGEHRPPPRRSRGVRPWPVLVLALPASIAIWAGWVGIGRLTGFGVVNLLPGIAPEGGWATIDTAITLPIGMEAYAAYALRIWLSGQVPPRARAFARWSAIGALTLGAAGQVAYHLMVAAGVTAAPWQITTALSCIPVAVLGMGAALYHLIRDGQERQ